jgi:hypothetical protein
MGLEGRPILIEQLRYVTSRAPSLAGRSPSFDHVLGDARLRDLKPELEQFAVNAWRTPKRILHAHPPDQRAQLRFDLRSPSLWARLPTPVGTKAGPVPTHECLGPDDCENLQDRRKPPIQFSNGVKGGSSVLSVVRRRRVPVFSACSCGT